MYHSARSLVPQEPLFSPSAWRFRSGSRVPEGVAWFDCFWARNAIFHGLRALGIQPGQKILVPAYICKAAIEPIDHFGAEVEFYRIRRNCVPDWADLESKIRGNVRAVVAVHYFGFQCDIESFCALRDRYGLFLIEDCAHVLDGIANQHRFGESGDFSVFSPRKHLPLFDGGRLRLNRSTPGFQVHFQFESPLFTLRVAKNLCERRNPPAAPLEPQEEQNHNAAAAAPDQYRPEKPLYVFPTSASFLPSMAYFPMSRLSRYWLRHLPIADIASQRRANYCRLLEKISGLNGVQPLYGELPADIAPWVLPVTIGDKSDAHTALRALGIPAVTWGGVRDPRIRATEFPEADFLYEHLVFLPIHQDLENTHLDRIADAVATVSGN